MKFYDDLIKDIEDKYAASMLCARENRFDIELLGSLSNELARQGISHHAKYILLDHSHPILNKAMIYLHYFTNDQDLHTTLRCAKEMLPGVDGRFDMLITTTSADSLKIALQLTGKNSIPFEVWMSSEIDGLTIRAIAATLGIDTRVEHAAEVQA